LSTRTARGDGDPQLCESTNPLRREPNGSISPSNSQRSGLDASKHADIEKVSFVNYIHINQFYSVISY
jgi:hypothetical protein